MRYSVEPSRKKIQSSRLHRSLRVIRCNLDRIGVLKYNAPLSSSVVCIQVPVLRMTSRRTDPSVFFKDPLLSIRFSIFFLSLFQFVFLFGISPSSLRYLRSNSPDYASNFYLKTLNTRREYYSLATGIFRFH